MIGDLQCILDSLAVRMSDDNDISIRMFLEKNLKYSREAIVLPSRKDAKYRSVNLNLTRTGIKTHFPIFRCVYIILSSPILSRLLIGSGDSESEQLNHRIFGEKGE